MDLLEGELWRKKKEHLSLKCLLALKNVVVSVISRSATLCAVQHVDGFVCREDLMCVLYYLVDVVVQTNRCDGLLRRFGVEEGL